MKKKEILSLCVAIVAYMLLGIFSMRPVIDLTDGFHVAVREPMGLVQFVLISVVTFVFSVMGRWSGYKQGVSNALDSVFQTFWLRPKEAMKDDFGDKGE